MKHVPVPANLTFRVVNEFDLGMFDGVDDQGKPKPAMAIYERWLIGRTIDDAFAECSPPLTGVDLQEARYLARKQIKSNCAELPASGFHSFDDDICKRLRHSTLHPKAGQFGPSQIEHNWYDWVQTWKAEPRSELPAAVVQPEVEESP